MIQRIQSVYLLIAAVLSIALTMSGLILVTQGEQFAIIGVLGVKSGDLMVDFPSMLPLLILAVVMAGLNGYGLLKFKDRKQQALLVKISFGMGLIYAAYFGYAYYVLMGQSMKTTLLPSAFHIVLILFANMLALRGINKDENLVKSVDRLR